MNRIGSSFLAVVLVALSLLSACENGDQQSILPPLPGDGIGTEPIVVLRNSPSSLFADGSGVSFGANISGSAGSPFTLGLFTANYYDNSTSTLVASETVDRPSINYSYSNFHNIDSYNFHAIWDGTIDVPQSMIIDITFDVSWSDVSLKIDGAVVSAWSNSKRVISHPFSAGQHSVVIEQFNHWHTTGFNTSFTTSPTLTMTEAQAAIAPLIDSATRLIYVGAYESADLHNNTAVSLQGATGKVFLFVSSYDSMKWVIDNANNSNIVGVAYWSNSMASTVSAPTGVPTFEIANFSYGYNNFATVSANIQTLTGRQPDVTFGAYSLSQAIIN